MCSQSQLFLDGRTTVQLRNLTFTRLNEVCIGDVFRVLANEILHYAIEKTREDVLLGVTIFALGGKNNDFLDCRIHLQNGPHEAQEAGALVAHSQELLFHLDPWESADVVVARTVHHPDQQILQLREKRQFWPILWEDVAVVRRRNRLFLKDHHDAEICLHGD